MLGVELQNDKTWPTVLQQTFVSLFTKYFPGLNQFSSSNPDFFQIGVTHTHNTRNNHTYQCYPDFFMKMFQRTNWNSNWNLNTVYYFVRNVSFFCCLLFVTKPFLNNVSYWHTIYSKANSLWYKFMWQYYVLRIFCKMEAVFLVMVYLHYPLGDLLKSSADFALFVHEAQLFATLRLKGS